MENDTDERHVNPTLTGIYTQIHNILCVDHKFRKGKNSRKLKIVWILNPLHDKSVLIFIQKKGEIIENAV